MGFDIVIHSPATILIIAGVLFLTFNDDNTGWLLVLLGALLIVLVTAITGGKKTGGGK